MIIMIEGSSCRCYFLWCFLFVILVAIVLWVVVMVVSDGGSWWLKCYLNLHLLQQSTLPLPSTTRSTYHCY